MSTLNNLFWKLTLLFIFGLDASKSTWRRLSSLAIQYNGFNFRKHFKFSVNGLARLVIFECFLHICPTWQQVTFWTCEKLCICHTDFNILNSLPMCIYYNSSHLSEAKHAFSSDDLKTISNIEPCWQRTTSRKVRVKANRINKVATWKLKSVVSVYNKRVFAANLVL